MPNERRWRQEPSEEGQLVKPATMLPFLLKNHFSKSNDEFDR